MDRLTSERAAARGVEGEDLPSGPLELEYLPLLHKSQVVSADSLGRVAEKRRRALEIVEEAASG